MPEGPEVKTIADSLQVLINRELTGISRIGNFNKLKEEVPFIPGKIITIFSYGKKLIISFGQEFLIFSFGMTGRISWKPSKYSLIKFSCEPDFYFEDIRRFGNVLLTGKLELNLGPDVFGEISKAKFEEIFKQKKLQNKEISEVLLDQKVLSGIGNYLKSEILYSAEILPQRTVASLTPEELEKLRIACYKIPRESYEHHGLTIENYFDPDGKKGEYDPLVYGKKIDALGNPVIKGTTKDQRTSYWVPEVQK